MSNRKQRMKNRETARWLAKAVAPPCPECDERGKHWISEPVTLEDLLTGRTPYSFWTCDKFYGPDGRRLDSARAQEAVVAESAPVPDLDRCPSCGGEADNGNDRLIPPNPYVCSKCEAADNDYRAPEN